MRLSFFVAGAVASAAASLSLAQVAVLHDGTVVTMKIPQQLFAVEGPIWDIDIEHKQVISNGTRVTIPATLNGRLFELGNTDTVDNEDVSFGGITTHTFDRLSDVNAATRDRILDGNYAGGPIRMGPVRSIFNSVEARQRTQEDVDRWPAAQKQMEDNYFFFVRNAWLNYAPGTLPANFLGLIGIRTETGEFASNPNQLPPRRFWRYPASSAATFMATGSVYVDAAGREFNIPDFLVKGAYASIVIAENVKVGPIRAGALGDWSTPDSFVMDNTLVIMNQDPRMPARIEGLGYSPMSREYLVSGLPAGTLVEVVGHMVGEHVMFAESILVEGAFDPAVGAWVGVRPTSWRYDEDGLQFTGEMVPAAGHRLSYRLGAGASEWSLPTTPVPEFNSARFDVRDLAADPVAHPTITLVMRRISDNAVVREMTYHWPALVGL
jgi:hypothetical protein